MLWWGRRAERPVGRCPIAILVVDDNRDFAAVLARELRRRGHAVHVAYSGEEGLALAAQTTPELIFLDLRLSDMSGLDVLCRVRAAQPRVHVVIITGYPELSSALAAIRGQVSDYLCKPFAFAELDGVLGRVFGDPGKRSRPDPSPAAPLDGPRDGPHGGEVELLGVSAPTVALRALIRQLAASDVRAAVISGESGTGKELVARMLHGEGPRRSGPFIAVNCSAVGETLFESEFFGHERGAFTGAVGSRRGLCELADGGTLFLDEVSEMALACQAKLLRFLDDQGFRRVGGTRRIQVDVQVVAATNRDLRAMVAQWTFRQDLYFRLNVAPIALDPLRERSADILPLAAYWLRHASQRYGKPVTGFTPGAEALLTAYPWPGNVRELRNLIERLVILFSGREIDESQFPAEYQVAALSPRRGERADAPDDGGRAEVKPAAGPVSLEEMERAHIRRVLEQVAGNKTKAAELLGISRQTLRSKLG